MSGVIGGIKGTMKKKFVASANSDPYWSNVTLLLKGDGSNGSTTFTDSSINNTTVTPIGGSRTETGVKKFGAGCIDLSTNNSYLVLDPAVMNFGTGDFTMEAWIYKTSATSWFNIFGAGGTTNSNTVSSGSTSNIAIGFAGDGSGNTYETWLGGNQNVTTVSLPTSQWVHVALTRSSGTARTFVNGTQVASYANTSNITTPVNAFIGTWPHATTGYTLQGYIDEIRFTKGVARYTATFTPPTTAFPTAASSDTYSASVSLLLNGDDLLDRSPKSKTVTNSGPVTVSTSIKKFGTGSIQFDSTAGKYLSLPASADFAMDTGDFTVECWVYITGAQSQYGGIFITRPTTSTAWANTIWFGIYGQALHLYDSSLLLSGGTVPLNQWAHIAMVRSSSTMSFYINGTSVASGTVAINFTGQDCTIGHDRGANAYGILNGYIDDLRVTKGIARYTTTFTPPTSLT